MSTSKIIVLKSSDGKTFEVEEAVALECQTIKHMIEDNCADTSIPLPNINSKILAMVIEYCKSHVEAPKSSEGDKSSDEDLKSFDADFVKVDQGTLFDLILAANFLDIKSLLDLTTQTVADTIKGKTPEEIRKTFNIKTPRSLKLYELQHKMYEARKANQTAMVAEKKRIEAPEESRGISKQKWLEDRKKKIGRLLDANGLEMSRAYMLDTQEMAESKYKKWEKEPAPAGWDVFNQKTLYNAYKKRTKNIEVDIDEYNRMKAADPEFYRDASSLQYGKAPKISEEKVDKLVKELKDREEKRNSFSRRRKYHEEKDIDSINDRNEHFNKKIERAFGKYTLEIKNNLERGTALPD